MPPLQPVPVWSVAPFVLLLLAIAVLPLVAGHFWHSNRNKAVVSALFAAPVAVLMLYLGATKDARYTHLLVHELEEYGSFILLLASLYTVSGGIVLKGDIQGKPLTNTGFLAFGAVLANLIGTTGASMLLIRPVLRINQERKNTRHLPVFFIFVVSNLGGVLTPLGDPPLFLGFLKGVPFFWTLRLWPHWLLTNALVLLIFLIWDTRAYRRERPEQIAEDVRRIEPLRVRGLYNLLFLAGILAGVLLQATNFHNWLSQHFDCPDPQFFKLGGTLLMAAMAFASWLSTPRPLRKDNGFTWGPIIEVAVLFAGIFVTMVPALNLLAHLGQKEVISQPWEYFWLTGLLSSFLDNAPTYVSFAAMAARNPEDFSQLATNSPELLAAISCGAVFMGANTYIGNGPNFMVKAIADEAGARTPSFFGYMLYSGLILLPVFGLVTVVFFLA
jgi:Na+/H+ antiporter NhaD/arsenite permease-like protein